MKKLMIAVAVMCAAVAVQAAQVNWTSSAPLKSLTKDLFAAGLVDGRSYDATGLLVTSADYKSYASGTLSYVLTITYDIGNGEVTETFKNDEGAGLPLGTTGKVSGKITSDLFDTANKGVEYTYTVLITDTGTDGKGNAFTLTASYDGESRVQPTGTIKFDMTAPSAWVATVAPEPTSGLLLLLGVGALALRRRRA